MIRALIIIFFATGSLFAVAQANNPVTSEELMRYATAMDSVDGMTRRVIDAVTERVKNGAALSASRYNELSKIANDSTQLAAANAKPEEVAALKEIIAFKDAETAKINQTFQSLAKDYVGAATFNKVKRALAADPALKQKYDSIISTLSPPNIQPEQP